MEKCYGAHTYYFLRGMQSVRRAGTASTLQTSASLAIGSVIRILFQTLAHYSPLCVLPTCSLKLILKFKSPGST